MAILKISNGQEIRFNNSVKIKDDYIIIDGEKYTQNYSKNYIKEK